MEKVIKERVELRLVAAVVLGVIVIPLLMWGVVSMKGAHFLEKDPQSAILAAVGVVVALGFCILTIIRRRKFGVSSLVLVGSPAPGDWLRGRLKAKLDPDTDEPVCLSLMLVGYLRQYSLARQREERVKNIIWQAEHEVFPEQWQRLAEEALVEVPFSMKIPALVRSEDYKRVSDVRWEMVASREMPGVDFRAVFKIPMAVPQLVAPEGD